EPDARAIKIEGHDGWEVADRDEEAELPVLGIESSETEFVALEGQTVVEKEGEAVAAVAAPGDKDKEAAPEKKINWAITVAQGHIFIGSHVGLMADALKAKAADAQLKNAKDLARLRKALVKLGSDNDSFRFFS